MLPLPVKTSDPNILQLARIEREDVTGVASATYVLGQNPVQGYLLIFKNGLLINNVGGSEYSVSGSTVTFVVPLVAGDNVTYFYWTRGS